MASEDIDPNESADESAWDNVEPIAPPVEEEGTPEKPIPTSKKKVEKPTPPTDEVVEEEGEPTEEEVVEEEDEGETGKPKAPAEPTAKEQELATEVETMRSRIEQIEKYANYYATAYNNMVAKARESGQPPAAPPPGQPQLPVGQPGALPEGVLPPEQWDTSDAPTFYKQMGGYLNHQKQDTLQQADQRLETVFKQVIEPTMNRFHNRISQISRHIAKLLHEDFDEVEKMALDDVFVYDPSGKVIDTKNHALLGYIQQDPFPELAAYRYGLSKKAPQKFKEGERKATQKIVDKLNTRPKSPTIPKTPSSVKGELELDWNTPPGKRDQILKKRGLL